MLDKFRRNIDYLRISVTDRCNLRCTYCMPEEGVEQIGHDKILSYDEIFKFVLEASELGVRKVRLTGGEPLVRKNIVTLVKMIASIGKIEDFGMTTNGTLLHSFAKPLKEAGLHRINISIDSLDPLKFREITRCGNIEDVIRGVRAAKDAGFENIKINTVIKESSEEKDAKEVLAFAKENRLMIRFIRKMNLEAGKYWVVQGGDGGNCKICNRVRLTSDGFVKPCLFSDMGFSVRELGARDAILNAIGHKPEKGLLSKENKFYSVGG